ncbi:MAG TPA: hypothetical protein VGS97_23170 [Actinocrinis sp.]|uniref:hypothetical protein n=1 Tax=Actinocrinis sp. TaxID=1920516 RepID=UPI002DDDB8F8|nr:hypothetical protein [Actinocrinis sp.]HEV2347022.1 hypothetical protein [Actinocrinis sp.]
MTEPDLDQPRSALDTNTLTRLLEAECEYQATRAGLGDAETRRYRELYDAYLAAGKDTQSLLAAAPRSITRASLAAALRRHAPAGDWEQLELLSP